MFIEVTRQTARSNAHKCESLSVEQMQKYKGDLMLFLQRALDEPTEDENIYRDLVNKFMGITLAIEEAEAFRHDHRDLDI